MITVVGGSVVLAKVSDGFRRIAENSVPGAADLFKVLIGPNIPQITKVDNKPRYYRIAFYSLVY